MRAFVVQYCRGRRAPEPQPRFERNIRLVSSPPYPYR
ncbi:hypothetical protein Y023_2768 [Burkholderia pseudomallei A79D]|nr:hypothetical protein Y023_2768 [Burkholderia pseudomallei A79D]KGY03265.1 hypothetical protein X997_2566 [Burkholderia pseudomallei A79C]